VITEDEWEEEAAAHARELAASREAECGICLEKTMECGRRFGLLTSCAHAFCLDCIRQWRHEESQDGQRMCPLCRKLSFFIVPSALHVVDEARKEKVCQAYFANTREIPCRAFDQGRGTCPFGSSCFYVVSSSFYTSTRRICGNLRSHALTLWPSPVQHSIATPTERWSGRGRRFRASRPALTARPAPSAGRLRWPTSWPALALALPDDSAKFFPILLFLLSCVAGGSCVAGHPVCSLSDARRAQRTPYFS
jgi:hypothetical protein